MSISALISPRAYRPTAANFKAPIVDRFIGDSIGFVSYGPCGILVARVQITKDGPIVHAPETFAAGPSSLEAAVKAAKKRCKHLFGAFPLVLGFTSQLEWQLKRNLEFHSNEEFAQTIRTDPPKVIGSMTDGMVYTGLLQDGTGVGLVLGVSSAELSSVEDTSRKFGCEVVRRTIPSLAVLNLMLADSRVVSGEFVPLVIDQGLALTLSISERQWQDVQGRLLVGPGRSPTLLEDLATPFADAEGGPRFLVAQSTLNGDVDLTPVLQRISPRHQPYRVGNLEGDSLFVYATTVF